MYCACLRTAKTRPPVKRRAKICIIILFSKEYDKIICHPVHYPADFHFRQAEGTIAKSTAYSILLLMNISRITKNETIISPRIIIQSQNVPVMGRLTFIP